MDLEEILWKNVDCMYVAFSCNHNYKLAGFVKCEKFY
jgi:hypothetical protein